MARFILLELGSARLEEEGENEQCGMGAEKGREMERRRENETVYCESLGRRNEPHPRAVLLGQIINLGGGLWDASRVGGTTGSLTEDSLRAEKGTGWNEAMQKGTMDASVATCVDRWLRAKYSQSLDAKHMDVSGPRKDQSWSSPQIRGIQSRWWDNQARRKGHIYCISDFEVWNVYLWPTEKELALGTVETVVCVYGESASLITES